MRTYIIITLFFLSLLGYGISLKNSYMKPVYTIGKLESTIVSPEPTSTSTIITTIESKSESTSEIPPAVNTPTPRPSTIPSPVITSTCTKGGSCTTGEVAAHNTRSDCFVSLSQLGRVYNITPYIADSDLHPGGDVIANYCGEDIFDIFMGNTGEHQHSSQALNEELAPYDFAELK